MNFALFCTDFWVPGESPFFSICCVTHLYFLSIIQPFKERLLKWRFYDQKREQSGIIDYSFYLFHQHTVFEL